MSEATFISIQRWGNSLALRIPSAIARSARLVVGQPVEIVLQDHAVLIRTVGEPKLTLTQKLALFDPAKHGGEAMLAEGVQKAMSR